MAFESLYQELEDAQSVWGDLYDSMRRFRYDTSAPRAAIDNLSVDVMHRITLLVFETLHSVHPSSDDDIDSVFFATRAVEIRSFLNAFKTHVQSPMNQIRSYQRENLNIRDANNNLNWQFMEGETNIANADVSSSFQSAYKAISSLQGALSQLLPFCKAVAVVDLSKRAEALSALVSEIEGYRTEAQKLTKAAGTSSDKANGFANGVQEVLASVQTTQAAVQATQQQVEKDNASVTTLVTQIKTTGAAADTLEQQITSYRSKFEAFQTQLDERLKQFAEFESNVPKVEKKNTDRETEIDRLTEKADSMIKGATTAGLSHSLEETRKIYANRMYGTGGGFIVAIILLAVSALPLAAHLLPGLFGEWLKIPPIAENAKDSAATIIGKIVLLLPATWLSIFFSKTFSEFFHLEREYAHKAALAKSVEGFKREAPDFEQEITTGVFGEILNSPSSRQSPEPASHPIYEVLTKRLTEWLGKKAAGGN